MTVIPNFILKRLYKKGSLQQDGADVRFAFTNVIGPGTLVKLNQVVLNGATFGPEAVMILVDGEETPAVQITEASPITVNRGQTVTCVIQGAEVAAGSHAFALDVVSREAGHVVAKFEDTTT